jgi:protein-disulfide isomerase
MTALLWMALVFLQSAQGAQGAQAARPAPAAAEGGPALSAGRVEIVLYSDFQCPFCALLAGPMRQLQASGVDGVDVVVRFKNFPLAMHPASPLAHQAALAAKQQGRFWEMHDLLFANQRKVTRDDLVGYARRLNLDVDRFQSDMGSEATKAAIAADEADGTRLNITGTPTYYINGRTYVGARSYDQLKALVTGETRRIRALADVTDSMLSLGPPDAAIVIELFADLESPVSPPALSVIDDVMRRHPGEVRLQFRNLPLSFHPGAAAAHEGAMAAAKAGRFWEFARGVLASPHPPGTADLVALAGRLGLDEAAFAQAVAQHRYAPRVDADLDLARKRGIRGSPALLVNGRRIDGAPTAAVLTQYVETELMARHSDRLDWKHP